jgi:hypothetical protein
MAPTCEKNVQIKLTPKNFLLIIFNVVYIEVNETRKKLWTDKQCIFKTNYYAIFKESMWFFFTNGYLSLKFEHFAVLSKNIRYYFDNKNLLLVVVAIFYEKLSIFLSNLPDKVFIIKIITNIFT